MDALMVENLRNEYREITLCWRHIATFRFGILPFMTGFSGWVINLMTAGYVRADALLIILAPIGGALGVWLLLALDDRLVKLYDIFLQRGVDIEIQLNIHDGVYKRVGQSVMGIRLRNIAAITFTLLIFFFVAMAVAGALNLFG